MNPTPRPRTEQTTAAHAEQVLTHGLRLLRLHRLSLMLWHFYDAFITDIHVTLGACGRHVRSVTATVNGAPVQLPLAELKNADHGRHLRHALNAQGVSMTVAGMATLGQLPEPEQVRLAHVISGALFQADPGHPLLTHLDDWIITEPLQPGQMNVSVTLPNRQPSLPKDLLTALGDAWKLTSECESLPLPQVS